MFDRIADLPVRIESVALERRERDVSADFTRVTTVVSLSGDGNTGRGEDVTYDADDHDALQEAGPGVLVAPDGSGLPGEYTLSSFSDHLDDVALFPQPPGRDDFRDYRRWAFESAALDLALRQAGTDLASALDCEYDPVRFVVSPRLGDPPNADRIEAWLDIDPDLEFKLDAESAWTPALIEVLAETDSVRIVDFKGHYEGTSVEREPDAALYRRVVEAFPDAVLEDPALVSDTRPIVEPVRGRLSWDAPIHSVADIEALPWEPRWLNVKPSRFGTIESLFETIEHCRERDISMYGGGQFELGVGRGQLHALASLFYPDRPNDTAPRAYNAPEPRAGLPASPLSPPDEPVGFGWD